MRLTHIAALGVAGLAAASLSHAALNERQTQLLAHNCLQCHARQEVGAPMIGKGADWTDRIKQGEESMLRNAVQGLRGMPPLGYCSACNEADMRALVRFVSGLEGPKP